MQTCRWCEEKKPNDDFYGERNICKPCLREYNYKYRTRIPILPKEKTYADYLKEAKLTGYAQRYLKHFT